MRRGSIVRELYRKFRYGMNRSQTVNARARNKWLQLVERSNGGRIVKCNTFRLISH